MKRWYKLGAALCVALSIPLVLRAIPVEEANDDFIAEIPEMIQTAEKEKFEQTLPSEKEPEEKATYVSPIDFAQLTEINPHIYAWLDIPEADTSYPVVQHPEDDSFYLDRDINGEYRQAGSLFTEHEYNSIDFNDPVTIIYGHYMNSGVMFGNLQQFYSNPENFEQNNEFTVYLPEKELKYQVFAATSYDNRHILDNYDFRDEDMFDLYFDSIVSIRSLDANINREIDLKSSDKVLILSTCLKGDYSQRYLVFAKQIKA